MDIAVVIPAYQPGEKLLEVVARVRRSELTRIVVVDDGSSAEHARIFEQLAAFAIEIAHHAVNLGKGAALRTGLNHALCSFPGCLGVVTADADGQHAPEDIARVARKLLECPEALVLGVREFDRGVPMRSRFGNTLTRWIVRGVIGESLSDTQTGLRGIPLALVPHLLKIPACGYEFELDMLISAKHHAFGIVQIPIRTIYEDGNRCSHFNPLRDSMRIYMVLFRFTLLSLLTALIDNVVFFLIFRSFGLIPAAQAAGRVAAIAVNYSAARHAVFLSDERHRTVLPKYLLLVAANGVISYAMIQWLTASLPLSVLEAKLLAEGILFVANFAIQRDLIFTRRRSEEGTLTERLSRRYTRHIAETALRDAGAQPESAPLLDVSGGDRAAFEASLQALHPGAYAVVSFPTEVLSPGEVRGWLQSFAHVVHERKLWHLLPRHHLMIIRRQPSSAVSNP